MGPRDGPHQVTDVPLVFNYDELLTWLLDCWPPPSADTVETVASRLGRNSYPELVAGLWLEDRLDREVARIVVPAAWSAVEFPSRACDEDLWRHLFDLAGYTVDTAPAERPSEPLTLWRGALPSHASGWSWTDDLELARWFAARPHNRAEGRVWVATVEPTRLLARITQQREGESEYVVDARGLQVAPM